MKLWLVGCWIPINPFSDAWLHVHLHTTQICRQSSSDSIVSGRRASQAHDWLKHEFLPQLQSAQLPSDRNKKEWKSFRNHPSISSRNQISWKCVKWVEKSNAVITLLLNIHSTNWRTNREIIIFNWNSNWPTVCRSERHDVDKLLSAMASDGPTQHSRFLWLQTERAIVESFGHDSVSILWLSFNWFCSSHSWCTSDEMLIRRSPCSLANQF